MKLIKKILRALPFKLTTDQRKASWQIIKDIGKKQPMNRLLEGDVASGKTIVAVIALAQTARAGYEACLMAPTKLLTRQHYLTVKKLLSPFNFKIKLLSRDVHFNYKRQNKTKRTNKKGTIYIGTHSRKKIITKIVNPLDRLKAYEFIKTRLVKGEQAFVIYPLVHDSDKLAIKSATAEYERLKNEIFSKFKVGLVHGQIKAIERDKIIKKFRDNQLQILVATAVVEVGIDIPNATMIIIEHSERFGLAQLHQFRGRVGRRQKQGFCFLFTESNSEKTSQRLAALINCHNGFKLAKQDLALRGPGEVFGTTQSGWPEFKMADIFDYQLTSKAKQAAISYHPLLEKYPLLKEKLKKFVKEAHFE